MGLGQLQKPRKWLSIHHGKVELSENGTKQLFSYVEGNLLSVYSKVRNYGGENVMKWFIDLRDEHGGLYAISFPYQSGTFKSVVLSLASDEALSGSSLVRIEPFQKGNFTNVVVWSNGIKLDWITKELPPVEEVYLNGRVYKDETKRMEYITKLVQRINTRASRS